ncbi:MAG: hypothetical protein H8D37_03680, partial [Chloroflexi bacterium]|nr:hypothetical protein [Chloroflexota bacterium]
QQHTKKIDSAEDERGVYETYYDFDFRVDRLRPHQILAINRAEREKILRVGVSIPERDWRSAIEDRFRPHRRSPLKAQMELTIEEAANRLLLPAIERDVRRSLSGMSLAWGLKPSSKRLDFCAFAMGITRWTRRPFTRRATPSPRRCCSA